MKTIKYLFALVSVLLMVLLIQAVTLVSTTLSNGFVSHLLQRADDYVVGELIHAGNFAVCSVLVLCAVRFIVRKKCPVPFAPRQVRMGWLLALVVAMTPIAMALAFAPALTWVWPSALDAPRLISSSVLLITLHAFVEEVHDRVATLGLGRVMKVDVVSLIILQALIFTALHGHWARVSLDAAAWYLSFGLLAGVIYYHAGLMAATLTHAVVNFWMAQLSGSSRWLTQPLLEGGGLYWKYPMLNLYTALSVLALAWVAWMQDSAGLRSRFLEWRRGAPVKGAVPLA